MCTIQIIFSSTLVLHCMLVIEFVKFIFQIEISVGGNERKETEVFYLIRTE